MIIAVTFSINFSINIVIINIIIIIITIINVVILIIMIITSLIQVTYKYSFLIENSTSFCLRIILKIYMTHLLCSDAF